MYKPFWHEYKIKIADKYLLADLSLIENKRIHLSYQKSESILVAEKKQLFIKY